MKPAPKGWPRISSALFYQDAAAAIDWLCRAFGFEVRIKVEGEGGRIEHSELTLADGVIMVGQAEKSNAQKQMKSPKSVDGTNTQSLFVYVDDVDALCARAKAAGATIIKEPCNTNYGDEYWEDRGFGCMDPEGHIWYFAHRVRNPKIDE